MNFFNRKKFNPSKKDLDDMKQISEHLNSIKAKMPADIVEAHMHSCNNKDVISNSSICGCFYCFAIFKPNEIKSWIGPVEDTAICPYCSIDSILGDASGFQINVSFLTKMHDYWFS